MATPYLNELADWIANRVRLGGVSTEITRYVQLAAVAEGHEIGRVDGLWGPRTEAAWQQMAGILPTPTLSGYEPRSNSATGGNAWPGTSEAELNAFYGPPGSNLVQFTLPYPMRLSWDLGTVVTRQTANRKCVDAFQSALANILAHYGTLEEVRRNRMDLLGGIYNLRRKRRGTEWSLHAYGAAIDLDPDQNAMGWSWPGRATMPREVVEIFEALGANAGARWRNPDAMHFQWTK